MGELLAALIFGVIIFGFTMLMLVPLFFAYLMVAVYKEPSVPRTLLTTEPSLPMPEAAAETEVIPEERPKVMAAGRRRPLP